MKYSKINKVQIIKSSDSAIMIFLKLLPFIFPKRTFIQTKADAKCIQCKISLLYYYTYCRCSFRSSEKMRNIVLLYFINPV